MSHTVTHKALFFMPQYINCKKYANYNPLSLLFDNLLKKSL